MAKLLGRSPSTVSREMSRNGGYDRYRATLADENATDLGGTNEVRSAVSSTELGRHSAAGVHYLLSLQSRQGPKGLAFLLCY